MDPITASAIISAISAGVLSGAKDAAKKSISDAYEALKKLLQKKCGEQSEVMQSVMNLENKPESEGYQMVLQENIAETKVDEDTEIHGLAKKLIEKLQQSTPGQHFEQHTTGNKNTQVQINGSGNVTIKK
ncbi:MAG: hypothetical protein R8K53_09980 [Mariprofundaceae bacterium]